MFGCEPKVGLTSTSVPYEIIEWLETEEDLLSTLQASSHSSPTNSADSPQHSIANSVESSLHTSEEHEHSPQSFPRPHTPEKSVHSPKISHNTLEINENSPESSCQSPETSLHILPSSEENRCTLESSVYACSARSPQLSLTSSLSENNACSQENSVDTLLLLCHLQKKMRVLKSLQDNRKYVLGEREPEKLRPNRQREWWREAGLT